MSVAAVFEQVPTSPPAVRRANDDSIESFRWDEAASTIVRTVRARSGAEVESRIHSMSPKSKDLAAEFDAAWIRASERPKLPGSIDVQFADLFAGCGAMSIGVVEACRALGKTAHPMFAADMNRKALDVYQANFTPRRSSSDPIEHDLDSPIGSALSNKERTLKRRVGAIDLVIGGPPCQGNSDLNNHTRRSDPKNALYLRMVRFAEVFDPSTIIIENVRGVLHDRNNVTGVAQEALERLGYTVEVLVIPGEDIGVPQRRRRVFLLASTGKLRPLGEELARYRQPSRSFAWACGDLVKSTAHPLLDATGKPSATNKRRIDYLFDNDCFDLPNNERPSCHRDKAHSYNSVYGRMRWGEPAPTITTGFGSMGQGRFVHPKQRRTITPREAARLQFIPDFFSFGDANRAAIAEMIGNAVPPKMAYVAALHLLR
ncbi:MAG TPA: DNA cytosine methyltransferase [Thermoanaerobaculia bacterium]|nr:DNA cytosine methyltransferase [Thermoanaerobaculia bacterium]